jgi:hypothetical protein
MHLSGLKPDDHPLGRTDHGILIQIFHIALNEDQQLIVVVGMKFFRKGMGIVEGVSVGENKLVSNGGVDPALGMGITAQWGGRKLLAIASVPQSDAGKAVGHVHSISLLF